jgi:UDP-2-acetamido-2,6-beta-L-arabino-hexul-4-ose reductase
MRISRTRIVVTGGDGFIGKNLRVRLQELGYYDVVSLGRSASQEWRQAAFAEADVVFHLAGANRPSDPTSFDIENREATRALCDQLRGASKKVTLVYSSSTQADIDNPYGRSKRAAEEEVRRYSAETGAPSFIFRLTNVFGKWCRPNYNSVVATFCHNIARGLDIVISDPASMLRLVYVDDVVEVMLRAALEARSNGAAAVAGPVYETTVGEVASMLREFAASRTTRMMPAVGEGFCRALYATYVSYLPVDAFAYPLVAHADARGAFAEVLRTADSGQFSFFSAFPGITRGGHYHNSKTEKFLVLRGAARFNFRHIITNEKHEVEVSGDEFRVVESVPGWAHDITNVGSEELIVMLWANEIFDPLRPDTFAFPLNY